MKTRGTGLSGANRANNLQTYCGGFLRDCRTFAGTPPSIPWSSLGIREQRGWFGPIVVKRFAERQEQQAIRLWLKLQELRAAPSPFLRPTSSRRSASRVAALP